MNIEKIKKDYKKMYLAISAITVYLLIALVKKIYFGLYSLSFSTLTSKEKLIATITYQIFAISMSLLFLMKNKDKTLAVMTVFLFW